MSPSVFVTDRDRTRRQKRNKGQRGTHAKFGLAQTTWFSPWSRGSPLPALLLPSHSLWVRVCADDDEKEYLDNRTRKLHVPTCILELTTIHDRSTHRLLARQRATFAYVRIHAQKTFKVFFGWEYKDRRECLIHLYKCKDSGTSELIHFSKDSNFSLTPQR